MQVNMFSVQGCVQIDKKLYNQLGLLYSILMKVTYISSVSGHWPWHLKKDCVKAVIFVNSTALILYRNKENF